MNSWDRDELEYEKQRIYEKDRKNSKWLYRFLITVIFLNLFIVFYEVLKLFGSAFDTVTASTTDHIPLAPVFQVKDSTISCSSNCRQVVLINTEDL